MQDALAGLFQWMGIILSARWRLCRFMQPSPYEICKQDEQKQEAREHGVPVANKTTSAVSSSPLSVRTLMPPSVLLSWGRRRTDIAGHYRGARKAVRGGERGRDRRRTSDRLVPGCSLIPLPSRFLATTALISPSKPLRMNGWVQRSAVSAHHASMNEDI